jgi:hypothetical protein
MGKHSKGRGFTYIITSRRNTKNIYTKAIFSIMYKDNDHDMALEYWMAVRALDEHIGVLKQNLHFFMANYKAEYASNIITTKQELDKAVQVRMRLSQICYRPSNNRVAVSAA